MDRGRAGEAEDGLHCLAEGVHELLCSLYMVQVLSLRPEQGLPSQILAADGRGSTLSRVAGKPKPLMAEGCASWIIQLVVGLRGIFFF